MTRIILVLLFLSGCSGMTIIPSTPKPETVYDPPPMFNRSATYNPSETSVMIAQWKKVWRDMGYSESEALKRAKQMVAIK